MSAHFLPYDGCFYLDISESGYHSGSRTAAFYPLWPFVMRWASRLFHTDTAVTGLVLSNLFSVIGWVMFFLLARQRYGESAAKWAVICLVLYPGSLFFQFLYSESLYFLLLTALWWALERRMFRIAACSAFLLPLTRGIGIFTFLPIIFYVFPRPPGGWLWGANRCMSWVRSRGRDHMGSRFWPEFSAWLDAVPLWGMGALLAPIFGFGCYLCLMRMWTGNAFEGFAAQHFWGVHSIANLFNVPKFILAWMTPVSLHSFTGSAIDRSFFGLLVCCLPILWKIDKKLIVWAYVLGFIPAMSGSFTSFTRFASLDIPMFIALGLFFQKAERKWFGFLLLSVFTCLHAVLVWRYANFEWAS